MAAPSALHPTLVQLPSGAFAGRPLRAIAWAAADVLVGLVTALPGHATTGSDMLVVLQLRPADRAGDGGGGAHDVVLDAIELGLMHIGQPALSIVSTAGALHVFLLASPMPLCLRLCTMATGVIRWAAGVS